MNSLAKRKQQLGKPGVVAATPTPRLSRRGFRNHRFSLEDLAAIYYVCSWNGGKNHGASLKVLEQHAPEIGLRYRESIGRELTANVISQRWDKAHRNQEVKRYSSLLMQQTTRGRFKDWFLDEGGPRKRAV